MGAALSRVKRRFSKRLKNAQEKRTALPVSSPKRDPLPALAESAPALTRYNEAISGPGSVDPQVEPQPHTPHRPLPFHSTPKDVSQESSTLSNKTFRLRGIYQEWDYDHVKRQVQVSFGLPDAAQVHIRSMSPDPSDSKRKIATLELTEMPSGIIHASCPSEWMPCARDEDLVLDTNFFGLTPLHETDDAKCTLNVIAVPGLNGHAFGSFKGRSGGRTYMWLRDSLAKDLPRARIFIYGYNTGLQGSHSFENIGDLALKLQHAIKVVSNNEGINIVRSTVLIGHSLGGIVIKQALKNMFVAQSTDRTIVESIRGLLLFGVPNQGMAIESLIPMVNNQPNRQLVETLNENSDVLRHVTDDFNTSFKSSHVKVVWFYETLQSPTAIQIDGIWSMSGPPAILVNRHSATQRRQNEEDTMFPVQATHSGMVKFENKFTQTYKIVLDHMNDVVEKAQVVIRELSESESNCLKSLSFSAQDTRQENIHNARGTCDWLLRHPTYSKWFSAHRQLLWINGKPGAGKSTLMKYLSNTLMNDTSSNDYILASFFVHGQGEEMERSKLGILRSLLHQILSQLPEHLSMLAKKFVKREERHKDWVWRQTELMEVLGNIATQSYHASRPVIILVDALDELGEKLAREVAEFLGTLISQSPNAQVSTTSTSQAYIGMRICFSSRHFPKITLPDCLSICVEQNNSDDIVKVVHEKLSDQRLSSFEEQKDPSLKMLEDLIIGKADGVFQWVMLVVERVLDPSVANKKPSAMQREAENLPAELKPLYSRILENATPGTFQLLQWICFSQRPLGLFELRQALTLNSGQIYTSLEEYEKDFDYPLSERNVHEMVKHLSCGLAEVTQTRRSRQSRSETKVRFIHQSVHDYLTQDGRLQLAQGCGIPSFLNTAKQSSTHLEAFSNAQIAAACIKFLRSKEVRENVESIWIGRPPAHVFLGNYAIGTWLSHIIRSLIDDKLPEFLLELLLSSAGFLIPVPELWRVAEMRPVLRSNATQECPCQRLIPSGGLPRRYNPYEGLKTMLHWLVVARSYPILKILTNSGQSLDTPDAKGRTPLMEAILTVNIKATTLLLNSGLDDVNCKDEQNQTPLHHAARDLPSLDIFASLLKMQTIVCDQMDRGGCTPLLWGLKSKNPHSRHCPQHSALGETLLQAAQWLLDGGKTNLNQRDEEGDSALAYAAREGHPTIVEWLINRPDVEINSRNKGGKTPIFHAVKPSRSKEFNLFLENVHTSLDLEDNSGRNVLSHGATLLNPQDFAKLVQKPNIGLDKQDNSLRTPLSYSVCRYNAEFSRILLDTNGVNPFVRDKEGRSPVSYAAQNWDNGALEHLWKFKSEINPWNEPDSRDRTPISYAAQGNATAVKLLLDDPRIERNQADCGGRTPLSYAAQHNGTAVRLLLDDPRIDRNKADCNGHTPLWYSVVNNNLKSLRHLLSDPHIEKTPIEHPILHKAIASKDVLSASLLIQAGWDVNMKDWFHRTPLFYVSNVETADLLLNTKGIELEVRDLDGRTALFCIAKNGCPEVIRRLVEEYGFDYEVKDRSGLHPWNCAGDNETRKLLFGPLKRFEAARRHRERRAARPILPANPKRR